MIWRLIGFVLLACSHSACSDFFGVYSPERIHSTVRSMGEGLYIVRYEYFDVINQYGPGVENVREAVRNARNTKDQLAAWSEAEAIAVPKYLKAKGLVPTECTQGVIVIRGGSSVEGDGWAEFRCKENQEKNNLL